MTRKLEARIRVGKDMPAQFLFNVFDDVAFDAYPGLEQCWNAFAELGAREIHISGSGPTIYALMPRREVGNRHHPTAAATQTRLERAFGVSNLAIAMMTLTPSCHSTIKAEAERGI